MSTVTTKALSAERPVVATENHWRDVADQYLAEMADLRAHIAALEADNAAKDEAFRLYVEERGVEHDDIPSTDTRCPEDDTCECPRIVALNAAFGPKSPGTALLERHEKALVRARNEGLRKAELHIMSRPTWVAHDMRGLLAAEIDAMKEPEL